LRKEYSISISNLSKAYKLYSNKIGIVKEAVNPFKKSYHKDFYALKNINLNIKRGEILGIIGPNGAGKSTLLKLISGILVPSSGEISVEGKVSALLNLGEGFNPDFTGYENVRLHCIFNGFSKTDINKQIKIIEEFAGIGEFINQPFRTYSSGMKARLAFATLVNVNPDILIIDEILSVGDEFFRRKCYLKMEEFIKSGKTILFVSHDLEIIKAICLNVIFINKGEIQYAGTAREVVMFYEHFIQSFEIDNNELIQKIKNHHAKKQNCDGELNGGDNANPYLITSKKEIQIKEMTITSENGEIIYKIYSGSICKISFKIKYGRDIGEQAYFLSFKDEKGIRITNVKFHPDFETEPDVWYQFECTFLCQLLKGIYFVDVGIGEGSFENVLDISLAVLDAAAFCVIENNTLKKGYEFGGYFYMDHSIRIFKTDTGK
jgi:ABC-type polysaccharide/polyol phosphate transport system ATPase subunit